MKKTGRIARAIAWVTFQEIVKDKVLYNILMCSFLLFGIGFLASRLTFLRSERVVLDFGLSAVRLSCTMIAIFTGAGLLGREFERRTIYVALSHPISKAQFVLGKFAGLALVLTLNWLLMSIAYLTILFLTGAETGDFLNLTWFSALGLAWVENLVIGSLAVLFSTFSTTSLSVIMTIGLYLVGNNTSELRMLAARVRSPSISFLVNSVATTLPNLEYFNLGSKVTYGLPISWQFLLTSTAYGFGLTALLLLLAGLLVQGREV